MMRCKWRGQQAVSVKVPRDAYEALRTLARETDRSIPSAIRILALKAKPQDVMMPVEPPASEPQQ